MNIIERIKNIILKPKVEWDTIRQETTSVSKLTVNYLLILALIPAIAALIRFGFFEYKIPFIGPMPGSFAYGLRQAVVSYFTNVGGVFLSAIVIDALAPNFSSQKNFEKAFQLVVYSYTAMFITGIFTIIPSLSILTFAGLYGLYLLYIGLKPMMQTPNERVTGYFVASLAVTIVVYAILFYILKSIFLASPS